MFMQNIDCKNFQNNQNGNYFFLKGKNQFKNNLSEKIEIPGTPNFESNKFPKEI